MREQKDPIYTDIITDQLLIVRYPGDEVGQLVVVYGPGLDQFLHELICSPEHQQNPAVVKWSAQLGMIIKFPSLTGEERSTGRW